jgi:hypothetical protein
VFRAFYGSLGFTVEYRDEDWMILKGHGLTLEFFPFPELDPATSSFSCCLRMDDVDAVGRVGSVHNSSPGAGRGGHLDAR